MPIIITQTGSMTVIVLFPKSVAIKLCCARVEVLPAGVEVLPAHVEGLPASVKVLAFTGQGSGSRDS
jgi:hypothetical protein